jgi:class I fructose-bisphosphate aldolase
MGTRVKEILSWYASENPGVRTNLARMLNHGTLAGTGRMVILPVDQGFEHGPARSFAVNPPAYDPLYHYQLAIDAGCNAYARRSASSKQARRSSPGTSRSSSR